MTSREPRALFGLGLICGLLLTGTCGCNAIDPAEAAALQNGVVGVRAGFHENLGATLQTLREGQLERVLRRKTEPALFGGQLAESDFTVILSSDVQASLFSCLDVLSSYTDLLRSIADKSYRGQIASAVKALGDQAQATGPKLAELVKGTVLTEAEMQNLSEAVGLFSTIAATAGEAIVDLYAQCKAIEIAQKYALPLKRLCFGLQALVQPEADFDPEKCQVGLSYLASSAYRQRAAEYRAEFSDLTAQYNRLLVATPPAPREQLHELEAARRAAAIGYRDSLYLREAVLARFQLLRRAIGEVGEAHSKLVADEESDFWSIVNRLEELGRYLASLPKPTGKD